MLSKQCTILKYGNNNQVLQCKYVSMYFFNNNDDNINNKNHNNNNINNDRAYIWSNGNHRTRKITYYIYKMQCAKFKNQKLEDSVQEKEEKGRR